MFATPKERFHAVMAGEPFDRVPYWEQGFWGGTVERWYREGMPRRFGVEGNPEFGDTVRGPASAAAPGDKWCRDVLEGAGLDTPTQRAPVELFLSPAFEVEVLEDSGETMTVRDELGIVKQTPKSKKSIPRFLRWPVTGHDDFERIAAERLNPDSPERFPPDWEAQVERLNRYEGVVGIGSHPIGFFGAPRYLMGEIELMIGFLDNPELVRRIIQHLVRLWSTLFDRILSRVRVDVIYIWEDMSYRNGPLISPALFREFLLPAYREVTDVVRSHGVKTVLVDTDGDCRQLIPLFLEGGVTGVYPFEVQAGMDVREIRRDFPELQILGGIDKRALMAGKEEIDAEVEKKVPSMVAQGRYIPMVDHQVPPEVSWENYLHYRRRVAETGNAQ